MGAHIPEGTLKWAVVQANAMVVRAVLALQWRFRTMLMDFVFPILIETIELVWLDLARKSSFRSFWARSISLAKEYDITLTVAWGLGGFKRS